MSTKNKTKPATDKPVRVNVELPASTHLNLKMYAVSNGISLAKVITTAVNQFLK